MRQIDIITVLPNWRWHKKSSEELELTGEDLLRYSDIVWQLDPILVMGLIYSSFLSPPWVWFLLAEDIKFSDLIDLRRLTHKIPAGSLTAVQADFAVGIRFAKFYGFVKTGDTVFVNSRDYIIMRKV